MIDQEIKTHQVIIGDSPFIKLMMLKMGVNFIIQEDLNTTEGRYDDKKKHRILIRGYTDEYINLEKYS